MAAKRRKFRQKGSGIKRKARPPQNTPFPPNILLGRLAPVFWSCSTTKNPLVVGQRTKYEGEMGEKGVGRVEIRTKGEGGRGEKGGGRGEGGACSGGLAQTGGR